MNLTLAEAAGRRFAILRDPRPAVLQIVDCMFGPRERIRPFMPQILFVYSCAVLRFPTLRVGGALVIWRRS